MKRLLIAYFLVSLIFPVIAFSENSTDDASKKQTEIIQKVVDGGVINEQIHDEFWSTMPKETKSQASLTWMMDHVKMSQQYQQELWKSALLSYKNKQVVKTEEYMKLNEDLKNHVKENTIYTKGTKDYDNFVNPYLEGHKKTEAENETILQAAANHSSITLPDGKPLRLTDKVINRVIHNLGMQYDRLKILIDPDYYTKHKNR